MSHKRSQAVTKAINHMYAKMADAAAKKAVEMAGRSDCSFYQADDYAHRAVAWADRAGANAISWRLGA